MYRWEGLRKSMRMPKKLFWLLLAVSGAFRLFCSNWNFSENQKNTCLMGPIAGIGDLLVVGTVIPILLGIAMGNAIESLKEKRKCNNESEIAYGLRYFLEDRA